VREVERPEKNAAYMPIIMKPRTTLLAIKLRMRKMCGGKMGLAMRASKVKNRASKASPPAPGRSTACDVQGWLAASTNA